MHNRSQFTADGPELLTFCDSNFADIDSAERPVAEHLRQRLEGAPWATIIAEGRWATMLVDVTSQHLHLCLRGAVLINPVLRMVADGRQIALVSTPLAYPTVILTAKPKALEGYGQAWGSQILAHDDRQPCQTDIEAALALLAKGRWLPQ